MQKHVSIESQLKEHLYSSAVMMNAESRIISEITAELIANQGFVSNKAIILKLLEQLETEHDVVKLDMYRSALEVIVQRTPDDVIG